MDQTITTSDAMMVLPTDVLGKRYRVMSYGSDGKLDTNGGLNINSTPSEFVVTATEDNTAVTIQPRAQVFGNAKLNPIGLTLNRGESFLVQADITTQMLNSDLTGSVVESNKPVAVFAGHQRSSVPIENVNNVSSRDYLLEQMLPISVWGTKYI